MYRPEIHFHITTILPGIGVPILKIRHSGDRLIFVGDMPILVRPQFILKDHSVNCYAFATKFQI